MTPRQALAGLLQIFSVFFFFGAGLFFTCLPFRPDLRIQLSDILLEKPELCMTGGVGFFLLTLLLTIGFYVASRGRYLLLNLGSTLVRIDSKVLHHTIASLMDKQFASAIRLSDVGIIRGRHLELRVTLRPMDPEAQEKLLTEAETHLAKLLSEKFGYHTPFTMQVLQP